LHELLTNENKNSGEKIKFGPTSWPPGRQFLNLKKKMLEGDQLEF
jgi:hypothetical protein